ncbi:MAG: MFS transporter, partial [Streptosporangiaceae bacterium]
MVVLDYAGVVILLPAILGDLGGGLDAVTWVLAAFILAFAVLLLPSGRLAERVGSKPVLVTGALVFALAGAAAALAPSIGFLIGMRTLQGAGAAASEAAVFALIDSIKPSESRSQTRTKQQAAFFLGAALGPVLPGAIVSGLSWEFFFGLDALLGLAVATGGAVYLRPSRDARPRSQPRRTWDVPGMLTGAAFVGLLSFALVEGHPYGWGSAPIVAVLATAGVALAGFGVVEYHASDPLVDLSLFGVRRFAVGNTVRAATEFTSLGIFLPLSHFLQVDLGYSALVAGSVLTAIIVGALVGAPIAEPLADRVDVRWLVLPGFGLVAAGTYWLAHVTPDTGWTFLLAPLVVAGVGIGALEGPSGKATRRDVPPEDAEAAAQVSYVTYLLGIGAGLAVVSAVWQSSVPRGAADAVNSAMLVCTAVALLGAIVG